MLRKILNGYEGLNRTSVGLKPWCHNVNAELKSRINRTSVGLKLYKTGKLPPLIIGPQSNQRGIETSTSSFRPGKRSSSLNRTSVGLKRDIRL